jgi:putative DNA primase/helicase
MSAHPLDVNAEEKMWGAVLPLPGVPPVAQFTDCLLPENLRPWIMDISDRMQCPRDFPAVAAVVTMASVVGRQMAIRPKREDDWSVIPNLWGAVIGRPGVLKTPAIQEPLKMLQQLDDAAREEYQSLKADYAASEMVAKVAKTETERQIKAALKKKDTTAAAVIAREHLAEELSAPGRRRYMTSDATVEKLGELLKDNRRGLLLFRDELVGWLASLEKEGREGARQFFLESWNGNGRFTVDRVGRGTVEISAITMSVLGGIQPGPLSDYLKASAKGGGADDGLIQRMQIMVWPDISGEWKNVDRWPDSAARDKAFETYQRLDSLYAPAYGATEPGDDVPFIRFDERAQELFDDWRGGLEGRLRSDELSGEMEAHLSKFRSLIPSLALLFHLADGGTTAVARAHLETALAWATYLEKHAARIYAGAGATDVTRAQELLKHIERGALPDPFVARDVYRNGWRSLDTEGTKAALPVLEDHNILRAYRIETGGRPRIEYQVHPAIGRSDG